MKSAGLLAVIVALLVAAGAGFVYSGVYDVGADAAHWPLTTQVLARVREHSIAARARSLSVPDLSDAALVAEGAEHYAAMCSHCHLAPGMESTEIRAGLYPQPPNLSEPPPAPAGADTQAMAARRFWIIKHGIKFSGMPAWGTTHDDASIWALVAFVNRLPELTADEYRALTGAAGGHSHAAEHEPAHETEMPPVTEPEPESEPEHSHEHEHAPHSHWEGEKEPHSH